MYVFEGAEGSNFQCVLEFYVVVSFHRGIMSKGRKETALCDILCFRGGAVRFFVFLGLF